MSHYVLVHGAWQTARTWDLAVPILQSKGHQVSTPALAGLGAGNADLSPEVSLDQQVQGILAELARLDHPVILAGHSYAGMVISAVAEQAPDRIERLVYVDTFLPDDGQCALDLLPPEIGAYFRQIANEHGNGWRLPGGDGQLDLWGLKPGPARDFVRECLCDFSIHCFEGRVALPHDLKSRLPALYISCTAPDYPARPFFAPFAAKARNLGWPVVEIESGHDCHVEKPDQFAAAL